MSVLKITDTEFYQCSLMVKKLTGIELMIDKKSLLEMRFAKRVAARNLQSFGQYMKFLQREQGEEELAEFIDLVTTHETLFFRTPAVWDYFQNVFLRQFFSEQKKLKIWSAAASSGDEAYSVGMLCEEYATRHPGYQWQLVATDISPKAIERANLGFYQGRTIENLCKYNREFLLKYLSKKEEGYQICEKLKKSVIFEQFSLMDPPSLHQIYDIVFLRNVLIYFQPEEIEKILANVALSMKKSGILILGESESITGIKSPFQSINAFAYQFNPGNS